MTDGVSWKCPHCKGCRSIRDGSFFSKSGLTLQKWLLLMMWAAWECPVTITATMVEVDVGTAINVYRYNAIDNIIIYLIIVHDRWIREVKSQRLLSTPIIQIDESTETVTSLKYF